MTNYSHHKQEWATLTRYIISCTEGTITLEIYPTDEVHMFICNLSVEPEYRRQGVTTELLRRAEEIAKEYRYYNVYLDWDERDTERFVYDWYLRNGYKDIAPYGEHARLLRKKL